ncbi:hypothetical protein HY17_11450 [Hyphomonas sp. CY54-11-8]|nr:hypothetical protein HY17_11450 [Hyphomonas sp. CY54-11-8]RAN38884.1 hypothetical protein HY26_17235 [Hyphomonas sp. GM-8P]
MGVGGTIAVGFFKQPHEIVGYALLSDVVIKTAKLFSQAVTATLSLRIGHPATVGFLVVHFQKCPKQFSSVSVRDCGARLTI